jgi:hypothetical protein
MNLETYLKLTQTEEIIIKEIFASYQDSLLRLYSGESGLFSSDAGAELAMIIKTSEYQTRLSDDFLKFQGFLEKPHTFNKADKDDLLVVKFLFYNYMEDLQKKYDEEQLESLLAKIVDCSNAHLNLEPLNPN